MAGVITRELRREMAKRLFEDIEDSANTRYYIGVGMSETWNDSDVAATPYSTERDERNFRARMQSIKLVTDYSFVVPRNNWTTGRVYLPYNDNLDGTSTTPYYVITDENQVYVCLKQAKNSLGVAQVSTVKPTGVLSTPIVTADGYVWKFLYSINTATANAFLSSAWMPVKLVDSAGVGDQAADIEQYGIQNAAIAGEINNITLVSGGTGYTSAPTVTIIGDGDSAVARATISGGSVVKVEIVDSASTFLAGHGYTRASVSFSGGGGSGASARANLAPRLGFGGDARDDLRSRAIMFDIKPNGAEGGDWLINNDFRQIGLLKNPLLWDSADRFTGTTANMLSGLRLQGGSSATSSFTVGATLSGLTSGASGVIDKLDSSVIYFHQNETTGFGTWSAGEAIEDDATGTGTLLTSTTDYILEPVADPFTGKLLYIENRAAVIRASSQTEDIKIVLQM
jgi:hypothetical protein